jgi:Helicase associated domain
MALDSLEVDPLMPSGWHDRNLFCNAGRRGHCRMPYNYSTVPGLGEWVAEQHQDYKRMRARQISAMNDTRIKLLEHAGFVWNTENGEGYVD